MHIISFTASNRFADAWSQRGVVRHRWRYDRLDVAAGVFCFGPLLRICCAKRVLSFTFAVLYTFRLKLTVTGIVLRPSLANNNNNMQQHNRNSVFGTFTANLLCKTCPVVYFRCFVTLSGWNRQWQESFYDHHWQTNWVSSFCDSGTRESALTLTMWLLSVQHWNCSSVEHSGLAIDMPYELKLSKRYHIYSSPWITRYHAASSYERRLARNCICYGLVCLVVTLMPEPVSFVHHARQSPPQTFAICQWPLTTRWVQRRNRCDLAYVGAADRYVTALRCHWEPPRKCTFVLPVSHDGKTGSSRAQSLK